MTNLDWHALPRRTPCPWAMFRMAHRGQCTACRGYRLACKQWNRLPGAKTRNTAIYQDPQTGAVICTEKTKELDAKAITESCP